MAMLASLAGCVSHPPEQRIVQNFAARERVVAEAEPLLRGLNLQVAPADLPANRSFGAALTPAVAIGVVGPALLASMRSSDDATRAIDCMTAAVYYEARSEPLDGQRAVAQVVLNRVHDRAFPSSVCGVVYQGSARATGCQFSFTCDGSLARPRDPGAWAASRAVAVAALNGAVDPEVGAATHYHTTAVSPWWAPSLVRLGTIGHHIFYRWPDALERALGYRQSYAGSEPAPGGASVAAPLPVVAGITIHASIENTVEHGVAVHRVVTPVADMAPVGAVAPTPVAAAAPIRPRITRAVVMGVRVHRGESAPALAGDPPTT